MTANDLTAEPSTRAVRRRGPGRGFEARRDAIIASAVTELNRRGVRGMTFAGVAAPLKMVPTGIAYYFRTKEDLAAAALLKATDRFQDLIAEGEAVGPGRSGLAAFISAYFEFNRRVATGEAAPIAKFDDLRALANPETDAAYVAMFKRARALLPLAGAESRGDRNGRTMLLLGVLTYSRAWINDWRPQDFGRVAQRMTQVLLDGFAPAGVSAPAAIELDLGDVVGLGEAGSREQFLRAATRLINNEGYHGASVDRISATLNLTKGALYHHNAKKDDLVEACFERTFTILWRLIDAAEAQGGRGLETLSALFTAVIRLQLSDAPLLRTTALTTVPPEVGGRLMSRLHRVSHRLASMLCDGIADGSLRAHDVGVAAQMLTAAINSASELPFFQPRDALADILRMHVGAVINGLAPQG